MMTPKLFFALTNAILTPGLRPGRKRAFDSVRPVSAIPYLLQGKNDSEWGGPGLGHGNDGRVGVDTVPAFTFPTPPFAEFHSGHSTFSAAGAPSAVVDGKRPLSGIR